MELIVKYSGDYEEFISKLANFAAVMGTDLGQGYAVIDIPVSMTEMLRGLSFVEDIELPKNVFLNELNVGSGCISSPVFRRSSYTGRGVIIGVIDTGVDYTSREFISPDGRTRIISIWDQSRPGRPPKGFNEGTEYTSEAINNALSADDPFDILPPTDISGHGTAVAGIAAGNTTGTAPEASIVAVRVRTGDDEEGRTVQLMKGLRYVINKASELSMPASINISYGMNEGSHRGDSLFESYISSVSGEWKISVIIPTGNEGGAGHHYEGDLQSGETIDIGFFTDTGIVSLYLSLWKNYVDSFSCELILPGGESAGVINKFSESVRINAGGIAVTSIYAQPSRRSANQEIFYDIRSAGREIPSGLWILRIRADEIVDGHFDIWLPTVEQVGRGTYFVDPSDRLTMTIPSTASRIIRTAGFNSRTGAAAVFSGRGIGCPANIIPDISAPAVDVSAPTLSGGISGFTGTSFAAPLAAGYAALLMQWGIVCGYSPFMYGEKLKAELHLLAERSPFNRYPDPVFGYGKIRPST